MMNDSGQEKAVRSGMSVLSLFRYTLAYGNRPAVDRDPETPMEISIIILDSGFHRNDGYTS